MGRLQPLLRDRTPAGRTSPTAPASSPSTAPIPRPGPRAPPTSSATSSRSSTTWSSLGLDLTYWTDVDLHTQPQLLSNHRACSASGHDEYWSTEMRSGAQSAAGQGHQPRLPRRQRLLPPDPLPALAGRPQPPAGLLQGRGGGPARRARTRRSPPSTGSRRRSNNPESTLIGSMYQSVGANADLVVTDASAVAVERLRAVRRRGAARGGPGRVRPLRAVAPGPGATSTCSPTRRCPGRATGPTSPTTRSRRRRRRARQRDGVVRVQALQHHRVPLEHRPQGHPRGHRGPPAGMENVYGTFGNGPASRCSPRAGTGPTSTVAAPRPSERHPDHRRLIGLPDRTIQGLRADEAPSHPTAPRRPSRRRRASGAPAARRLAGRLLLGRLLAARDRPPGDHGPRHPPRRPLQTRLPAHRRRRRPAGRRCRSRPALAVKVDNYPAARPQSGSRPGRHRLRGAGRGRRSPATSRSSSASTPRWSDRSARPATSTSASSASSAPAAGARRRDPRRCSPTSRASPIINIDLRDPRRQSSRTWPGASPPTTRTGSDLAVWGLEPTDTTPPAPLFTYSTGPSGGGPGADSVAIPFSATSNVVWHYDPAMRGATSASTARPPTLLADGIQNAATNVVVQFVQLTYGPWVENSEGGLEVQANLYTGASGTPRSSATASKSPARGSGRRSTSRRSTCRPRARRSISPRDPPGSSSCPTR